MPDDVQFVTRPALARRRWTGGRTLGFRGLDGLRSGDGAHPALRCRLSCILLLRRPPPSFDGSTPPSHLRRHQDPYTHVHARCCVV